MKRRNFIKTSCTVCLAISTGMMSDFLESCSSLPVLYASVEGNKISVPKSIFTKHRMHIVHAKQMKYDIALEKQKDGKYLALLLECTHAYNPLTYTGNGFICTLHGSRFDLEGKVSHGPAQYPLTQLPTQEMDDVVVITLNENKQ
jgi:Rieske Fe-S protein